MMKISAISAHFSRLTFAVLFAVVLAACWRLGENSPVATPTLTLTPSPATMSIEETPTPLPLAEAETIESTATSTPTPDRGDEIVLTIWHGLDGKDSLAFLEAVAIFQQRNPQVVVIPKYIPFDDLYDRFVAGADGDSSPDLVLGPEIWGPGLYDTGRIEDLSEFASPEIRASLNQASLKSVEYKSALIGLPYSIRGVVMYRNAALIEENLQTFSALVSEAQSVTQGSDFGAYLERGEIFALGQMQACGVSLMYQNGNPAFNDPAGICWLNLLQSFADAGPTSFNTHKDLELFETGRVGVIIDGTWNLDRLLAALGDDLAINPWPDYGDGHLSGFVWSENIYMNAAISAEEKDAAWNLIAFLLSPQAGAILADYETIPAMMNAETSNPLIEQAVFALARGTGYPLNPRLDVYWEPLNAALQAVFNAELDPVDALRQANDEIAETISRLEEEENEVGQ